MSDFLRLRLSEIQGEMNDLYARLDKLTVDRQDMVLALVTDHDFSHQDVADEIGLTRGRVFQIIQKARKRARPNNVMHIPD